jgi:hypothetical protein
VGHLDFVSFTGGTIVVDMRGEEQYWGGDLGIEAETNDEATGNETLYYWPMAVKEHEWLGPSAWRSCRSDVGLTAGPR